MIAIGVDSETPRAAFLDTLNSRSMTKRLSG